MVSFVLFAVCDFISFTSSLSLSFHPNRSIVSTSRSAFRWRTSSYTLRLLIWIYIGRVRASGSETHFGSPHTQHTDAQIKRCTTKILQLLNLRRVHVYVAKTLASVHRSVRCTNRHRLELVQQANTPDVTYHRTNARQGIQAMLVNELTFHFMPNCGWKGLGAHRL